MQPRFRLRFVLVVAVATFGGSIFVGCADGTAEIEKQESALSTAGAVDAKASNFADLSAAVDAGQDMGSEAHQIIERARARFRAPLLSIDPRYPPLTDLPLIDLRTEGGGDATIASVADTQKLIPQFSGHAPLVSVALPVIAQAPTEVTDTQTPLWVHTRLAGARDVPAVVVGGFTVYPKASATGADVIQHPTRSGVEDFLVFEQAPADPAVQYQIDLGPDVAGVRLVGDVVELLDKKGAPRLHMSPPTIMSADGTSTDAKVSITGCTIDTDPGAPWDHEPVNPGARSCTIEVRWDAGLSYPAMLDPYWSSASSLTTGRYRYVATAMPA